MQLRQARRLFPGVRNQIYMDIAARALLSRPVRDALEWYLDDWQENGGTKDRWMEELARTRARFATLINAAPEEIAYTKNVSEGLNIIANALPWRAGDNVVLCPDIEHPNNIYVWLNLRRRGVEVRFVASKEGRVAPEDYVAAIDGRTRVVSASHVSFAPGRTLDLAGLASACRERDVFFLVDAAQSGGVLHIDVEQCSIDGLAVSSHKALLGPYGMGFLYCRRRWLERLEPAYLARYSVLVETSGHEEVMGDLDYRLPTDGRRFEIGNYNYPAVFATGAALDLLLAVGTRRIEEHVLKLAARFTWELEGQGLHVCSGRPGDGLSPMVTVGRWGQGGHYSTDDPGLAQLFHRLSEAGVKLSLRRGLVRFSLHLYNSDDEVDRVLELVRQVQPALARA